MKLRFIVLFLLLLVCMFYTSCSYAYTVDDFINFTAQVREQVPSFNKSTGVILNNQNGLRNLVNGYDFTTFICTNANYTQSFESCKLIARGTPVKVTVTIGNVVLPSAYRDKSQWYEISYFNGWSIQRATYNPSTFTNTTTFGLVDLDNQEVSNWFNNWFNGKYIPPYTGPVFTPSNNGVISVYNSLGVSEDFTRLPYYPLGDKFVTLGYVTDFDDVYQINGYFGPFIQSNNDGNNIDAKYSFLYNYYYGTKNGNLYFDSSTGRVYVNRDILLNKQGYNLYLSYQLTIADDDATDFYEGGFYSYDGNINIPSGDLISTELPNYTDINAFINSFGNFWEDDSGDKETNDYNINSYLGIGNIWSGDFFSGDILKKGGYKNYYDNDYTLFIYNIYRNVIDIISNPSTDSYIDFDFRNNHFTFYASDFTIPSNPLKSFISLFLVTGIFILLIQQLHSLIVSINVLDIRGVLSSFDRQHTFFM